VTHQVSHLRNSEQLMILNNGEIIANDSYEHILAKPNDLVKKLLSNTNENEQISFENENVGEEIEYSIDLKEKQEHKWFESTNSITTKSSRMFIVRKFVFSCILINFDHREYFTRMNKKTLRKHIEVELLNGKHFIATFVRLVF